MIKRSLITDGIEVRNTLKGLDMSRNLKIKATNKIDLKKFFSKPNNLKYNMQTVC